MSTCAWPAKEVINADMTLEEVAAARPLVLHMGVAAAFANLDWLNAMTRAFVWVPRCCRELSKEVGKQYFRVTDK